MLTESTNDWCFLGSLPLRRVSLYEKTNLPFADDCLFASCPFGGPVAIAKPLDQTNWGVFVFTANGEQLAAVRALEIHRLSWTKCLRLIVVGLNGEVRIFNVRGEEVAAFEVEKTFRNTSFIDAIIFNNYMDTGLAVIDSLHQIYIVNSVVHRLIWKLSNDNRQPLNLTAWTVVATDPTSVILCYGETIYSGSQGGKIVKRSEEWFLTDGGKYVACQSTWDANKVAFVHNSGMAQISTADLSYLLHAVTLIQPITINMIPLWCGNDILAFRRSSSEISFYSMTDNENTTNFFQPVWFDADSDGLRCYTKSETYLITVVPSDIEHVFGLLTSQPGAYLYYAYEGSTKKDYNTFEFLTRVRSRLSPAIEQCMNAAAHHFDASIQRTLMSAVRWASSLFVKFDSCKFVYLINILRCLNAARQIGLPISFSELNEFTSESFVDRITELRHWPLALSICKTMGIEASVGSSRIMQHWTNVLLEEASVDGRHTQVDELATKICNQFAQFKDTSYADIAETIFNKGKNTALANKVLQKEKDVLKQVQMLLKFDNVKEALEIANNSHLPNLAYMVISHLRRFRKKNDIDLLLLRQLPHAARLYQGLVREDSPHKMLALYEQSDDFLRQALIYLEKVSDAKNSFDPASKNAFLVKVEDRFAKFGDNDLAGLVKNSSTLYTMNSGYDQKKNTSLSNSTIRDSFVFAIGIGNDPNYAEKLKKEFKLSDKQVMRWTIEGFVKAKNTTNLNDLTYKKNYPGYMTVIEICVRCNDLELAQVYVNKIQCVEQKCEAFCLISKYSEAADLAAKNNDLRMLRKINLLCVSGAMKQQVLAHISAVCERRKNVNA